MYTYIMMAFYGYLDFPCRLLNVRYRIVSYQELEKLEHPALR